nr:unnamed protein product [Callosobruchus chinensis]
MEPYLGKQPEGPYCIGNSAQEIVLRLVQPIGGLLAYLWLVAKKLTYVGTEFLPRKDRQEKTSIFGFQEDASLVSYC